MFLTDDDKEAIALADAIKYLNLARAASTVAGNGWEIDDMFVELIEALEFE